MKRKECLEEAIKTVCEDRQDAYGDPEDNFRIIANMWSTYTGASISASDVAIMMIMLKISRIKTGKFKDDNYVDIAGYAACACEQGSKSTIADKEV